MLHMKAVKNLLLCSLVSSLMTAAPVAYGQGRGAIPPPTFAPKVDQVGEMEQVDRPEKAFLMWMMMLQVCACIGVAVAIASLSVTPKRRTGPRT